MDTKNTLACLLQVGHVSRWGTVCLSVLTHSHLQKNFCTTPLKPPTSPNALHHPGGVPWWFAVKAPPNPPKGAKRPRRHQALGTHQNSKPSENPGVFASPPVERRAMARIMVTKESMAPHRHTQPHVHCASVPKEASGLAGPVARGSPSTHD